MRRVPAGLAALLLALAWPAHALETVSQLVPSVLHGSSEVPQLWLAQRVIEREWGPADDSTYRTVEVKGWKSDGMAMALSAALPGAGQLYVGEGSGWLFMAGEALGWVGRTVTRRRGHDLSEEAAAFVGDPTDSVSTWSFARYSDVNGGEATLLRTLWDRDRDAFYQALARDPGYRVGFAGSDPAAAYSSYRGLRQSSQDEFRRARYLEVALWLHHLYSAFDGLRAARFHDLPLRRTLDLQLGGGVHRGRPSLRAALIRRF
jgi:hypothetical protein